MSGICGAWPIGQGDTDIEPILSRLERRGPDGTRRWSDGEVALGHTLLATTPEALVEKLPLTDPLSGCTITADVRLDNREALIAEFDLSGETRTIGDGELILRAYLRWGDHCPERLLGDFAFAIWDPREPRLFCARDHMGVRQFNYHYAAGTLFAFATEAEAVVAHPLVSNRLDEGRVADAMYDFEGIDFTSSFYEEVAKLPPAHSLKIDSAQGLTIKRYWALVPPPQLRLESDEAYAQGFLDIFTEAVKCRLRSPGAVGSMLSGGMDSGSVTAVAAQLLAVDGKGPLATFSAVGPDSSACVETRTIHTAIAALNGIESQHIDHSDLDDFRDDLTRLWDQSHPFDYHMTLIRAVNLAAHRSGLKIVLNGVGGDVVLSAGNVVARLLRRGLFRQAWREAVGEQRFWGPPCRAPKVFAIAAWITFIPRSIRKLRREIAARWRHIRQDGNALIAPEFAKRVALKVRRKRFGSLTSDRSQPEAHRRADAIQHPHPVAARERYDRVAAAMAIEPRDPFLDIRLISFCLSLPDSQLQSDGWPKIVLRRAMQGKLPAEVLWRRGKEHLGWSFTQALFAKRERWEDGFEPVRVNGSSVLAPIWHNKLKTVDSEEKIRLFALLRWLRLRQGP